MRLLVQHGAGCVPISLAAGDTVASLKAHAEGALGVPVADQRLVFGGQELADFVALGCCALRDGNTVQLVRRCLGGSAAARANAAMKRKRERKELQQMMQEEASSDEEFGDLEEYPECLEKMTDDLKALMEKQMNEFQHVLKTAIEDPGPDQENLENLTSDFNKLLYNGFVQNKGFYPLGHAHHPPKALASRSSLLLNELHPEREPGLLGILRRLLNEPKFKNFIVGAILVAGVNVGILTYLDCGQNADGQDYQSCYVDTLGGTLRAESEKPGSWTKQTCAAAKGCWENPSTTVVSNATSGTGRCWEQGPMPECMTGDTADTISQMLETLDFIILLTFTFECLLKIACEGAKPWLFCKDLWNVFDALIVILCYLPAGGNVAVLRLLRLARLLKLLHAVEDLQVILSGLAAGFGSIGYIMVLLVLVFYLFAIMANMMFAENDPVEFKDLDTAMVTLFRMSTMEDWTDVMYINMYGCAVYGYGSFCFDADYCAEKGDQRLTCTPETSHAMGYPAAVFFITFVIISGYVVMSLFIGVITTSMATEADKHVENKKAEKQRQSKLRVHDLLEERRRDGTVVRPSAEFDQQASGERLSRRFEGSTSFVGRYLILGKMCRRLVSTWAFQNMITGCIIVAAVLIGCQTYDEMVEWVGPEMDLLDALILAVFTLELMLKVISCGVTPWRFFFDPWNTFDFIVVFFCLMPLPGDSADSVAVLRLLRLLRVLKLFKAVPQLQIILTGLAKGMSSIGYIALLQTLLMYVFGIIAIMFYRANDPVHFGSLSITFVTLFRVSTFEDWTDIMFIAMYGCKQWSYGEFDFRCENDEKGGLLAAVFFITFVLLSALIMLNLVIGSICSSMSDAQEAYELEATHITDVQRISIQTAMRGSDYNLPGVAEQVLYAWIDEFEKLDSNTSALALEASLHKDDMDLFLELIGEQGTLRNRSIEELLIRANHTVPLGLLDMMSFMEVLANDLMSKRIKDLAERTGWVVINSCDGLPLQGAGIDPFCIVLLNGKELGRTHTISHSGDHSEWNERIGVPVDLLTSTTNVFAIEVMDDSFGADKVLAKLKVVAEGKTFRDMQEAKNHPLTVNEKFLKMSPTTPSKEASINMNILPPRISFQDSGKKTIMALRAQASLRSLGATSNASAPAAVAPAAAATTLSAFDDFENPIVQESDSEDGDKPEDT